MCIFFFQAEDGIRDLVRSRGLRDVYKRQFETWKRRVRDAALGIRERAHEHDLFLPYDLAIDAVSYTHLTLPTSDLV